MKNPDFDFMKLIEITCKDFGITTDEFFTKFRYGNLPLARQVVCYLMKRNGYKNYEIAYILQIKPSSVSKNIQSVSILMNKRQRLEKELDTLLSSIVRRRDLKYGCITCGRALIYETATAGHFMKRANRCTRWSVVNVNAQCWNCNSEDDYKKYYDAMIRRYGKEITHRIILLGNQECKYSLNDLREIHDQLIQIKNQL